MNSIFPLTTILAIDPGKTTGYCLGAYFHEEQRLALIPGEGKLSLIQIDSMLQFMLGQEHGGIVYEDFSYRNASRAGLDLTPVKIIGVIELYRERYESNTIGFWKQQASQGKAFYTDDRLKDLDVYWAHGKGHARDATRHLLQWFTFQQGAQLLPDHKIDNVDITLADGDWLLTAHYNAEPLIAE